MREPEEEPQRTTRAERSGGGGVTSPAVLNRLILVTSNPDQDKQFLGILGLQPVYTAEDWRAYGRPGDSEGSVEVINSPPLEGATAAAGFVVDNIEAVHERVKALDYEHTEPTDGADGPYFFVRDPQGRFWQFNEKRRRLARQRRGSAGR